MSARFIIGRNKASGKPINIKTVRSILKHDFVCPECNQQLTCVLNVDDKTKHFRHRVELGCGATSETLLHLTVKEILAQNSSIMLPNALYFNYSTALLEEKWDKYRPDVTLINEHQTLYVEVVVSNYVGYDKKLKFENERSDCLVIDLNEYDREFDYEQLEKDVLHGTAFKHMLNSNNVHQRLVDKAEEFEFKILLGVLAAGILYVGYSQIVQPLLTPKNKR